jgi:diacylglycerol diphosphate phosphatase / phosphatidate phosphatase
MVIRNALVILIIYRHDVYDVTYGSLLGIGIAYFSYRRYYPRLRSPKCDEPFPSRGMTFKNGVEQNKDDEEAAGPGLFELDDSDEAS